MMSTRLVPKEPETSPTIFDAAQKNGWKYLRRVKADPEHMIPGESVFQPAGVESTTIHYVDDFIANVKYILLKSEDVEELQDVAYEIGEAIAIFSQEEILELYPAAKTLEERLAGIRTAGVGAPGRHDAKFFEIFRAAFSATEPEVRLAAIKMSGYAGWPELLPLVIVASEDADESVREYAGKMVAAMKGK